MRDDTRQLWTLVQERGRLNLRLTRSRLPVQGGFCSLYHVLQSVRRTYSSDYRGQATTRAGMHRSGDPPNAEGD